MIEFTIPGKPIPQQRHRDRKGGKGKYDPCQKEKQVFAINSMPYAPKEPFDFPLTLNVRFFLPRPKDHYETRKAVKGILKHTAPKNHINRPDVDNLVKFVKDALNGLFWSDDSVVCDLRATKQYSSNPRTEISIMECE